MGKLQQRVAAAALATPLVLTIAACGSANSQMPDRTGEKASDPITEEAYAVVGDFLRKTTISCGKDLIYFDLHDGPPAKVRYYKNFSYSVEGDPADGADKANGVEWRGTYSIHADMFNDYLAGGSSSVPGRWTKWIDHIRMPDDGFGIERYRGNWYMDERHTLTPDQAVANFRADLGEQTARNATGHYNTQLDCQSFKRMYGFSDQGETLGRSKDEIEEERMRPIVAEKLRELQAHQPLATH